MLDALGQRRNADARVFFFFDRCINRDETGLSSLLVDITGFSEFQTDEKKRVGTMDNQAMSWAPLLQQGLGTQIDSVYPVLYDRLWIDDIGWSILSIDVPSPLIICPTEKSINKCLGRFRGVVASYARYSTRASVSFGCCGARASICCIRRLSLYAINDAANAILLSPRSVACTVRRAMISP